MDDTRQHRLSVACTLAGIPLTECGRRLGVTRNALYRWAERGDPDMSADSHYHRAARSTAKVGDEGPLTAARIAAVLGCPAEALHPGGPEPTWVENGEGRGVSLERAYLPPVAPGRSVVVSDRGELFLCEADTRRMRWVCQDAGRHYEQGDEVDGVQEVGAPVMPATTRAALVTQDNGAAGGAVCFAGVPLDVLAGPVLAAGADPGPEVEAFDIEEPAAGLAVDLLRMLERLAQDRAGATLAPVLTALGLPPSATAEEAVAAIQALQGEHDEVVRLIRKLGQAAEVGAADEVQRRLGELLAWAGEEDAG